MSRMATRALVVRNPSARSGERDLGEVYARLEAAGMGAVEARPSSSAELSQTIARQGGDFDIVFVAGGDGSLNAALPGLLIADRPLGILPCGTANDFARSLGVPADPDEACDQLLTGDEHRVDVGEVNGALFLNVAGIGIGPELTRRLDAATKRRWGTLAYPGTLLRVWRNTRPFDATIDVDGKLRHIRSRQINVANGRRYGGFAVIDEAATVDDAELTLHSVAPLSLWRLAAHSWSIVRGRAGKRQGHRLSAGRRIHVDTARPLPITADGELVAHTPATFRVLPGRLRVLVPKHYWEDRRGWRPAA